MLTINAQTRAPKKWRIIIINIPCSSPVKGKFLFNNESVNWPKLRNISGFSSTLVLLVNPREYNVTEIGSSVENIAK